MVRILENPEIEAHYSVTDYLPIAEEMYEEWGAGRAASWSTMTVHNHVDSPPPESTPPVFHAFRSSGGSIKSLGAAAVRINSDLKHWPVHHGINVQERLPIRNGQYNGTVLLFDNHTGELQLLFPDGIIQTFHVAGGIAMGAKYLARRDASVLGMYGVGHQAEAHLPALCAVRNLDHVKVYSPTRTNRESFATRMNNQVSPTVTAVDDPAAVCKDADIVNCATNSTEPVFEPEWIEEGTHLGSIRPAEIPQGIFDDEIVSRVVIPKADQRAIDITGSITGYREEIHHAADPWRFFVMDQDPLAPKLDALQAERPDVENAIRVTRLPAIMAGTETGRTDPDDITFFNQTGHGIAFAAIGAGLRDVAGENDLGNKIPTGHFMQDHVP